MRISLVLTLRCFEEMSKVEFAKGELVFDVSMGGCGKRRLVCVPLLTSLSIAQRVLPNVVAVCREYNQTWYPD